MTATSINLTDEQLKKLLERTVNSFGRYQKFIIVALCWHNLVAAISNTLTSFYIYTPDNFECAEEAFQVLYI